MTVALLAWGVEYAVSTYHDRIALAGKSGDRSPVAIVIAGETLTIPANMIRFPATRGGGTFESVDLLLHWPSLEGYSEDRTDDFRDGSTLAPLVYVTIAPRDNHDSTWMAGWSPSTNGSSSTTQSRGRQA